MFGFGSCARKLIWILSLACAQGWAQNIPDAPQPKVPVQQFPADAPPAPKNSHDQPQQPADTPAEQQTPTSQPVAPGDQQSVISDIDVLQTIRVDVRFVEIPVTVKDSSGRLVEGLTAQDFTIYEDREPQRMSFFYSQPFPLSVAVVVDTDLPAETMKKINDSLPALVGAFSEFDEIGLYRYGASVEQVSNFSGATTISDSTLQRLRRPGRTGPPPAAGGPFNAGPTINGHAADPGSPNTIYTAPPREPHVMNDAILRAANDLATHGEKARRRVIFVLSDGRESGSHATFDQVRKVLLARNIAVYAVGVDTASIPVYDKLNRIRIPGLGYGDLLPRYAVDTAGEVYPAFSRDVIEQAYSRITETARNQYTMGFYARGTAASNCHELDVHVHRPDLRVLARQSYCPLPPTRREPTQTR
ncbi:MAG TPA: VWA domain-containing protein [Candidatus Angelobacter sp.]|nr:VWA domain-containing protein [Candidatus Angelobacter sp.]